MGLLYFEYMVLLSFPIEHVAQYTNKDYSYKEYGPLPFVSFVSGGIILLWRLIDDAHDVLIAMFTAGILWFTFTLADYTKRLWGATIEATRAITRLEGPRVLFIKTVVDTSTVSERQGGNVRIHPFVRCFFKNTGKAPADLRTIGCKMLLERPDPDENVFVFSGKQLKRAVANAMNVDAEGKEEFEFAFDIQEFSDARLRKQIYILMQIRYRDVDGTLRTTRQCLKVITDKKWMRYGGREFNYAT